ncbi:hypothetical protein Tco_1201845 [Tanacetum coccineum]
MISGAEIDGELTEKEAKQVEADDQSIQTILMGLPEDIYVAVDSCNTAKEICQKQTYSGENIKQSQVSQQSTAIMEAICPSCSSNEESARSGLQPVVRFLETESGGESLGFICRGLPASKLLIKTLIHWFVKWSGGNLPLWACGAAVVVLVVLRGVTAYLLGRGPDCMQDCVWFAWGGWADARPAVWKHKVQGQSTGGWLWGWFGCSGRA